MGQEMKRLPELAADERRVQVVLQWMHDGETVTRTAHADYHLWSGVESPETDADDVSLLGLWGADGTDLLRGERECWPRKTAQVAYIDLVARAAVARGIVAHCEYELAQWLDRDSLDDDAGTPGEIGAMGRYAAPRRGLPTGSTHISAWGGA